MPRYLVIKQDLLQMISGMENGYRLPSRIELCKILDTTQATLGKAVNELIAEGILATKSKSGTYVARRFAGVKREMENWAVIFPLLNSVYGELIAGIRSVAEKRGANLIYCETGESTAKQESYIKRMMKADIEGFIIVPPHSGSIATNVGLYSALIASEVPYIFCNRPVDGVYAPVVRSNDFYGGYTATRYLLNRGYQNIAFISRMYEYRTSLERCQGYMAALQERGMEINRRRIVFFEGRDNGGVDGEMLDRKCREQTAAVLATNPDLDGVVCFNDETARLVVEAIDEDGRRISDDIGVIGYDNSEACEGFEVGLTSVDYRSREIGAMAAKVLTKLIGGEKVSGFSRYLLLPRIEERQSCRGPKGHNS